MDPVADMLSTIKNGYMAKKDKVQVQKSKFKLEIAKVMEKNGFISTVSVTDNQLQIDLRYTNHRPAINEIKRVSKLGLRTYTRSKNIKKVKGGKGVTIISTPKGVMDNKDARSKNLGGEIICQIW